MTNFEKSAISLTLDLLW